MEPLVKTSTSEDGHVRRIMLNRPGKRNAQSRSLLIELDAAMREAEEDDAVHVVILGGVGMTFSAGHDMGSTDQLRDITPGPDAHPSTAINGGTRKAAEQRMLQEWHYFFQNTLRWRNLRKITIAEVHGEVFSAGLMLMWSCDLVVAAEGTTFADVVGTRLGMCGLEYFAHPWELGPRLAKELLLTGESLGAERALAIGMLNRVVPADQLAASTDNLAARVAALPTMAALLIKESVNQAQDSQGFTNSLNSAFSLHQLNHSHWAEIHPEQAWGIAGEDIPDWRGAN